MLNEEEYEYLKVEKRRNIVILQLNRPEKKNALSKDLREEIMRALDKFETNKKIKAVIIYGGSEVFCAGFDRNEVQASLGSPKEGEVFFKSNEEFHHRLFSFPKLMVAAVCGYALGGGFDLAVLCHLRVVSENATFGHPEISFGATPLYFPYFNLVGRGKAIELILNTANKETFLNAEEIYRLNMANRLVKSEEVLNEALKLAKSILKSPDFAVDIAIGVTNQTYSQKKAFDKELQFIKEEMEKRIG